MRPARTLSLLLVACPAAGLHARPAQEGLRTQILRAEDARPRTEIGLAPIRRGLTADDSVARRLAVRALGRLERPEHLPDIAGRLGDAVASVRAEAANALAQAAGQEGAQAARRALEDHLGRETVPLVRGAVFRSLGRLRLGAEQDLAAIETLLFRGSHAPGADAADEILAGVTHGLGSLYRRTVARRAPTVAAAERLVELTVATDATVRLHAMDAFVTTGRTDSGALLAALRDPEWQVRRLVLVAARTQPELPGRERIIRRAWSDPEPMVRYEALRAYGRHQLTRDGCTPLLPALEDPDPHVRLLAIDLLAECGPIVSNRLRRIAREPFDASTWHEPAHALVALARIHPASLDSLPERFLGSELWWPRVYAARAAAQTGHIALLKRLAGDPTPNVRTAALGGLRRQVAHAADSFYVQALSSDDYEVLLTATDALDGTSGTHLAVPALLSALARLTRARRETSRDPRLAMLGVVGRLADSSRARDIRPYLRDFDPAVAAEAAAILARWADATIAADPRPSPSQRVPAWSELDRLARLRPVIVLPGDQHVVLRLLPFEAPTNVARFVRLARAGWFDGLSFHRVVPGFVVQGGSPGANEYMGDGPFTRDELGLVSNRRGTVGLSTRGRDTGDGQIFINLVENLRLDHEYTVFAEVESGMEHVDRMMEGQPILRVELEPRGAR